MKKIIIVFFLMSLPVFGSDYVYRINPDNTVTVCTKGTDGMDGLLPLPNNVDPNKLIYFANGKLTNSMPTDIKNKERRKFLRSLIAEKEKLLEIYKKKGWNDDQADIQAEIDKLETELNAIPKTAQKTILKKKVKPK